MKILWVKSDFLHPTNQGGQIRTLGMLRRLHHRHEVHYVCFALPDLAEGLARCGEYCTRAYPVPHVVPETKSLAFAGQLVAGLFSGLPVAVTRRRSKAMRDKIHELSQAEKFDAIVCDFLSPAPNIPDLAGCVLFQHNVEAMIWKRHVEHASSAPRRLYFDLQAKRMLAYEGQVCRTVQRVIAVSEHDANTMRSLYGVRRVDAVPTGVDLDYFAPPPQSERLADLVFVGSMDWMANIDGIRWFADRALPLIRRRKPDCVLALAGRNPGAEIQALAKSDPLIRVTGTVPDIRPWLWGSAVSIVPLRIGGGTRLKIYEAMAARIPVVSTTVGAEGLDIESGRNIHIADDPRDFADRCIALLEDESQRSAMAATAWDMVATRYSWEGVTQKFEELLLDRK
jgi:glycosyltransferase involved in cell wall biosynthesis